MSIHVGPKLIEDILKHWDDDGVKELLEAMRVEMRRDLRKCPNKNFVPILESIIEQLETKEFWKMIDYITNFEFDP